MVKDINGRLGFYYKVTDESADGNENKAECRRGKHASYISAGGHKADICSGKEEDKTDICIYKTDNYFFKTFFVEVKGENLEQSEENDDGKERNSNLFKIMRKGRGEHSSQLNCIVDVKFLEDAVITFTGAEDHTENQNGKNGTDGAKGNKTEAVVGGVSVASYR